MIIKPKKILPLLLLSTVLLFCFTSLALAVPQYPRPFGKNPENEVDWYIQTYEYYYYDKSETGTLYGWAITGVDVLGCKRTDSDGGDTVTFDITLLLETTS
jgi:hypothetical protein